MKYITEKDSEWHDCKTEMPPTTTDVEFLDKNDNIVDGHIHVDMSGFYAAVHKGVGYTWSSFSYYKAWRFKTNN